MADLEKALEMARCTQINLENMVQMMPVLAQHPLLPLVRMQIGETIDALEETEDRPQPIGRCPDCGTEVYSKEGFCGTCHPERV